MVVRRLFHEQKKIVRLLLFGYMKPDTDRYYSKAVLDTMCKAYKWVLCKLCKAQDVF